MHASLPLYNKVVAYVTRGRDLLVFTQAKFPEAGTQVPAGTLEQGEDPAVGVLREIQEETGLELSSPVLLEVYECDLRPWKEERHLRYVFHVVAPENTPDQWTHWERHASDGSDDIEFNLRWEDVFNMPEELAGYQGDVLAKLRQRFAEEGSSLEVSARE